MSHVDFNNASGIPMGIGTPNVASKPADHSTGRNGARETVGRQQNLALSIVQGILAGRDGDRRVEMAPRSHASATARGGEAEHIVYGVSAVGLLHRIMAVHRLHRD